MMRTLLVLLSLALTAGVAAAYVQPAHLSQSATSSGTTEKDKDWTNVPAVTTASAPIQVTPHGPKPVDRPADPVPEPGTMALASLGLIALGAAVHRKRH